MSAAVERRALKLDSLSFRLRWVLPDPASERAVDALGMGAGADRIADFLLPQLSVATRRARYLSFFCWAVQKSGGDTGKIHRLEAALAVEEAKRHTAENSEETCPGVVGRSRAKSYLGKHQGKPPTRPERLYKNTAFAVYRPTLCGLGLLTGARRPALTEDGKWLAALFKQASGRRRCCLSEVSSGERGLIKRLLGLDGRQGSRLRQTAARRKATKEEVATRLRVGNSSSVLEHYGSLRVRRNDVAQQLYRAYVWELLSCGLMLAFARLLYQKSLAKTAAEFRRALKGRLGTPRLQDFSAAEDVSVKQAVAFLRAALRHRPRDLGFADREPIRVAELLVRERKPERFLTELVDRHRWAKTESPWVALVNGRIKVLATGKNLPDKAEPRSYRLDAFKQILLDLNLI